MLESGWIKALELPAQITGGLASGCFILYVLDKNTAFDLSAIGVWFPTVVIVVGVLSACLFWGACIQGLWPHIRRQWRKKFLSAEEKRSIEHLDNLSEGELEYVTQALMDKTPSFVANINDPSVGLLRAKKLVAAIGGQYDMRACPFTFTKHAWKEIQKREEQLYNAYAETQNP